jgi:transposase
VTDDCGRGGHPQEHPCVGGRRRRDRTVARLARNRREGCRAPGSVALGARARWGDRVGDRGLPGFSHHLEQALLAAGECVVRVEPKLMGASRRGEREPGKSDQIDARAIARAVLQEGIERFPVAFLDVCGGCRRQRGCGSPASRSNHVIAITRGRIDSQTRAYLARKEAERKSRIEANALPQAPPRTQVLSAAQRTIEINGPSARAVAGCWRAHSHIAPDPQRADACSSSPERARAEPGRWSLPCGRKQQCEIRVGDRPRVAETGHGS